MAVHEFEEAYLEDERRIRGAILSEPISALAHREPVQLPPTASLADAIRAMNDEHIGYVLVVERGVLVGIFTERDLLRRALEDLDPARVALGKVMTPQPETLRSEDGIAQALQLMTERGFRHIPLVDRSGRPTGIVAMRDIVRWLVSMFPDSAQNLPPDPRKIPTEYGG
jgi:CBS domain-containing protein